jgi:hypothetical protein
MKNTAPKAVYEAVSSTFENIAFLEICTDSEQGFTQNEILCASVERQDANRGGLSLLLPRPLVEELARNSLGELEINEDTLRDVLGETCNVIAGIIGAMECTTLLLSAPAFDPSGREPSCQHTNHYFKCLDQCFVVSLW